MGRRCRGGPGPLPRPALSALTALFALLCIGCGESRPGGSSPGGGEPRTFQAGDTLVIVVGAPRHPGTATLLPEMTIGMTDGPEEYLFGGPSEVLIQQSGDLVVLDWAGGSGLAGAIVRRYGADGQFLGTVGGPGNGPGEYSSPTGLAELPDGRIAFTDNFNARISVYSAGGAPLESWPIAGHPILIRGAEILRVAPDGTLHMRFTLSRSPGPPPTSQMGLLRLRPDGTVLDTILPPELPDVSLGRITATRERSSMVMGVPYSPGSFWSLSPLGYFVTVVTNRYAIDLRTPPNDGGGPPALWKPGDPITSIRRDVPPVSVSAGERADQRQHLESRMREFGTLDGTFPEVPATKPYFKWIQTFEDGRIWALLSTPSESVDPTESPAGMESPAWREPTVYDVFEPDGTYLGQVAVPEDVAVMAARGDLVWGLERGDLGVPRIVRYRIEWGG